MSSDSHGFRQIVVIITYQHNIISFCLSPTLLNRTNYRQNMVNLHYTNNYEEFTSLMKTLDEAKQQTFIVFTGTTNEIGQSWCSDCVEAEPVIQKQVELNEERLKDANLVYAQVGKREEWKNNNENPFKLDKKIRLQFLPTLLRWGTLHKLQVEECLKPDLLDMIFED